MHHNKHPLDMFGTVFGSPIISMRDNKVNFESSHDTVKNALTDAL